MNREPRIEPLAEKKLVGQKTRMSFSHNRTFELWRSFMPRRKEIRNSTGPELLSVEVYDEEYFNRYDPGKEFDKWAAVEVTDFHFVPPGMERMLVPSGLYAVFTHRGPASEGLQTYRYIFETWLPASGYLLDHRPHFAVMGEKYKREDPDSEEEIFVPVKPKLYGSGIVVGG